MSLTRLLRPLFAARSAKALYAHSDPERSQTAQLRWLLSRGERTLYGRHVGLHRHMTATEFASTVPIAPYPELRQWVMRMVAGEKDVLWPGRTVRFAQSSGTSDGKSKYIPVTPDSLRINHYRGGSDAVAHYLRNHPDSRLFDGRAFILGGSFSTELDHPEGVRVGDLSANLIEAINPVVNLVRVPPKRVALMADWGEKLPALARMAASRSDITNISGVPSWFLSVLKETLSLTGARSIREIWPRLEVFFHGGISMAPYRQSYAQIIGTPGISYVETYNASEGFFAVQDDPAIPSMALLIDAGVYYEFEDTSTGEIVTAWEVKPGKVYSLIISAPNGLWRYPIGDTVLVHTLNPLRISIAGRTKAFINAFGEELMVHNTDAAVTNVCAQLGCSVSDYTAGPEFTSGTRTNGHHHWIVEFDTPPTDPYTFARLLDSTLRSLNSDYDAKRTNDLFLAPLTLTVAPQGTFLRWLADTGKLGGQRKVPRLSNDSHLIDTLLKYIDNP